MWACGQVTSSRIDLVQTFQTGCVCTQTWHGSKHSIVIMEACRGFNYTGHAPRWAQEPGTWSSIAMAERETLLVCLRRFVQKWSGEIEGDKITGEWGQPDDANQDVYGDAFDDDSFTAFRSSNDLDKLR